MWFVLCSKRRCWRWGRCVQIWRNGEDGRSSAGGSCQVTDVQTSMDDHADPVASTSARPPTPHDADDHPSSPVIAGTSTFPAALSLDDEVIRSVRHINNKSIVPITRNDIHGIRSLHHATAAPCVECKLNERQTDGQTDGRRYCLKPPPHTRCGVGLLRTN